MTFDALRGMRAFNGQRVQRTDLPSSPARCPMAQCVYCQAGVCDEAAINKGNSDAACHRMNNREVLEMLQKAERGVSAPIMTVLKGRVTTNVAMLPNALRTNRPTRAEAEVAADVIERLYADLQAARSALSREQEDASKLKLALHRAIGAIPEDRRRSCDILFHTVDRVVDLHCAEQRAAAPASEPGSHS